jgi:short-subunit dehydrogenase
LFELGAATAESVARGAYRAMQRRKPLVVHGLLNWLLVQSLRFSPRAWVRAITASLNRPSNPGAKP